MSMQMSILQDIHDRNAEGTVWGRSVQRTIVLQLFNLGRSEDALACKKVLTESGSNDLEEPKKLPLEVRIELAKITGWPADFGL